MRDFITAAQFAERMLQATNKEQSGVKRETKPDPMADQIKKTIEPESDDVIGYGPDVADPDETSEGPTDMT